MPDPISLMTDRLFLRPWRIEDREPFAALNADPVVMEYFPAPLTRAESDAFVDRICQGFAERGWGLWAVEPREGSTMIGYVGLSIPRFEAHFAPCVEVGWRLVRSAWGQGFAIEAARAACHFAFEELLLNEVVSFTARINTRSIRVMQRLGMTSDPGDDFDHPSIAEGDRLRRHVLYRINRQSRGPEFLLNPPRISGGSGR